MKNPYNSVSVFRVFSPSGSRNGQVSLIIIGFSPSGVARAFVGYSNKVIGKASGYGYDKEGAALAEALEKDYGVSPFNGAAGLSAVIEHAKSEGVEVKTLSDMVWGN